MQNLFRFFGWSIVASERKKLRDSCTQASGECSDRMGSPSKAASGAASGSLNRDALSFLEVVAQSVANIAPSATPALIIPLVFASAGNATWLAYALATVALLFVTPQINVFAARSASPGALYTFTRDGMGFRAGALCGWSLLLAYIFTASATLAGFTNYFVVLLEYFGISVSARAALISVIALDALLCAAIAWKDVKLSTRFMLGMEMASVGLITALAVVFFARHGPLADPVQAHLAGVNAAGLRQGVVLAFFSFVGFESATALGHEAKNPLVAIPRSVFVSVVITGGFFVAMAYTLVQAFHGSAIALDKSNAPLATIAEAARIPWFAMVLTVGILLGQFACTLASVNAAARVLYSMARDGYFHESAGKAHDIHATPHVAVVTSAAFALAPVVVLAAMRVAVMDIFGYAGTLATFGFLFSYAMVSIAAPLYLRRQHELRSRHIAITAAALVLLAIPIVGSVYPVPEPPYKYFPYIYVGLMAIGAGVLELGSEGIFGRGVGKR
jgi:amino acid transporter